MQQLALILSVVVLSLTLAACVSSKPERREKANQFDTDGDGNLSREEYAASGLSDVICSPSRSLAMKRSLSSIGLHSFQGIWALPKCSYV